VLYNLTLLSLFTHLASLAATQTAYGAFFSTLRWISLFLFAGSALLLASTSGRLSSQLKVVDLRVLVYLGLWAFTVINSDQPLFSGYRWAAHAMIVVSCLVCLPRVVRMVDAWKLLLVLKLIIGLMLVVSYLRPAEFNVFDDRTLYKGIFGNPNALGHMAAVGCLLFLHGFITQQKSRWGQFQAVMAGLAGLLMIQSGARSSTLAFLGGFSVLFVLYRSRLSRYLALGGLVTILALVIYPDQSGRVENFVFKHGMTQSGSALDRVTSTRQTAWESHWEGFEKKPVLGWGFGVDQDTDLSQWHGELTALGSTGRDSVNDIMYTLESGGVVGLVAYVLILSLIFNAWIPRVLRARLDVMRGQPGNETLASVYEVQRAFFCLTALLIVLFELDNTALAAGNFFAALLWFSLGLSIGLYNKLRRELRRHAIKPSFLRSPVSVGRLC
jgi:O-antigen ligase